MNIYGMIKRLSTNEDGNTEVTLELSSFKDRQYISTLDRNTLYKITLTEAKSKRTIQQNKMLWELIHEIAVCDSGHATHDEDWDVYIEALERANAKYEYVACLPSAENMLRNQFRAIKYINSFEHKGKTFNQYKCFYGSSKMDTKEMGLLLDTVLDMASQRGIETERDIYG